MSIILPKAEKCSAIAGAMGSWKALSVLQEHIMKFMEKLKSTS